MNTLRGKLMGGAHKVCNVEYSSYKIAVTKCKLIFEGAWKKRDE
jgi:hypothetical protein